MDKQKVDRIIIGAIICIVLIAFIAVIYGAGEKKVDEYERYQFVTVSQIYDDNNTFQKIVYDHDTMVLYVVMNGNIMTPLYNADGTLRTYKPE